MLRLTLFFFVINFEGKKIKTKVNSRKKIVLGKKSKKKSKKQRINYQHDPAKVLLGGERNQISKKKASKCGNGGGKQRNETCIANENEEDLNFDNAKF